MTTAQRPPAKLTYLGRALAVAAVVGLGASLAACEPQASPTPPAATASAAPTAAPSSAAPVPTSSPSPTESAAAGPTGATPSSTQTPLCPASSLTGALNDGGAGAAGHTYLTLTMTNSSAADCILDGYSGVSMVAAGTTTPLGAPADRDPQLPSSGPITLAPGDSADATLRYTQAGNYPDCQPVQADSILVYPPEATDHLEIARPLTACSNAGVKLLTIGAFQP